MAVYSPLHATPTHEPEPQHVGGYRVTTWALGIVGAIAAFLGAFILLGGDEQSIGLGGEVSWTVGEIDPAWGYGLLIFGALALLGTLVLALRLRAMPKATKAQRSGWSDVLGHAGVFLVVNAFLWIQDIALGDGLNYAYWVTIPWGIGLTAHALAQYVEQRRTTPRTPA